VFDGNFNHFVWTVGMVYAPESHVGRKKLKKKKKESVPGETFLIGNRTSFHSHIT
jgi:hypothetical protein